MFVRIDYVSCRNSQWATKGGHAILGMTGLLDLVKGVFLWVIWPKNSIKTTSKTLQWPEEKIWADFWLSR